MRSPCNGASPRARTQVLASGNSKDGSTGGRWWRRCGAMVACLFGGRNAAVPATAVLRYCGCWERCSFASFTLGAVHDHGRPDHDFVVRTVHLAVPAKCYSRRVCGLDQRRGRELPHLEVRRGVGVGFPRGGSHTARATQPAVTWAISVSTRHAPRPSIVLAARRASRGAARPARNAWRRRAA